MKIGKLINKNFQLLSKFFLASLFISSIFLYFSDFAKKEGILLENYVFLGGDYISFYVASIIYNNSPGDLYNFSLQKEIRIANFPELNSVLTSELYFIYPPLVGTMLSFISRENYISSYLVFSSLGFVVLFSSLFMLCKKASFFDNYKIHYFLLLILGYPAYIINCLIGGQLSWLASSIYALCYVLIKSKYYFFAGIVFSLSYYKPPLFVISLFAFIFFINRKFTYGFLCGAFFLIFFSYYLFGHSFILDYVLKASTYTYGQDFAANISLPPAQGAGVVGLIFSLPTAQYIKLFFLLILYTLSIFFIYKTRKFALSSESYSFDFWYSFVVVCSSAMSLQFIRYDLTILIVPFLLIISNLRYLEKKQLNILVLLISLFYFEAMFRFVNVLGVSINLSSIIFIALGIYIYYFFTYLTPQDKIKKI